MEYDVNLQCYGGSNYNFGPCFSTLATTDMTKVAIWKSGNQIAKEYKKKSYLNSLGNVLLLVFYESYEVHFCHIDFCKRRKNWLQFWATFFYDKGFSELLCCKWRVSGCQVPTSSDWQLLKLQFSPLLADWPVAMMEGTAEYPKNWREHNFWIKIKNMFCFNWKPKSSFVSQGQIFCTEIKILNSGSHDISSVRL